LRLLLSIAALGIITGIIWIAAQRADRDMRNNLLQQARLVARSLSIDHVKALTGTEADRASADYQRIKAQLVAIGPANPKCKWLYLMGRRHGQAAAPMPPSGQPDDTIFFFVNSEAPDALDTSQPGPIYSEMPSGYLPVFDTKNARVVGPTTNRWGTWVSALVPLTNPETGTVMAVLGMDIEASTWKWDVAHRVVLPVGLMLVLLIVVVAAIYSANPVPDKTVAATPKPILWRLLPSLAGIIIVLMIAAGSFLWQQHRQQLAQEIINDISDVSDRLRTALNQQTTILTAALQPIASNAAMHKSLRESDADGLLEEWRPLLENLHRENQITHFSFLDSQRVCLLRVEQPAQRGDIINRFTTLKAERTGKTASGIELGPQGTLTLHVVQPVFDQSKLIGYVELGKEIEHELQLLRTRKTNQLALLIRKEFLSRKAWEEAVLLRGKKANWDQLPDSVVIHISQGYLPDAVAPLTTQIARSGYTQGGVSRDIVAAGMDWRVSATPLKDASKAEIGDLLILRDITSEKAVTARLLTLGGSIGAVLLTLLLSGIFVLLRRTDANILAQQAKLLESEQKHRLLFERASDAIFIHDSQLRILAVNPTACEQLGYSHAEFMTMTVDQVVPPDQAQFTTGRICQLAHDGQIAYETVHQRKDGSLIPIDIIARLITWDGCHAIMSNCRDISKRRRAETATLEAEWKFQALFEKGPIGVAYPAMIYDDKGNPYDFRFLDANASYCELTGVNPCGKTAREAFPGIENDPADWIGAFGRVARTGESIHFEQQLQPSARWYDCIAYQYKPDHFVTTYLDITERKQAEEQVTTLLEKSTQARLGLLGIIEDATRAQADLKLLGTAIEQAAEMIVITDARGFIQYVNPAFEAVTGYTREEAIGQNPNILNSGQQDHAFYQEMWRTITSGKIWQGRFFNLKKNDEIYIEEATISPVLDASGTISSYVAVMRDITAQQRAEEELQATNRNLEETTIRANKMAMEAELANIAKSEFLANMSHEIRTPMNGIIGMNGLLLDTELTSEQRTYAEIVRTTTVGLLSLINDILDFSKIEAKRLELETLDFNLSSLLDDFTSTLALHADEKNLELLCRIDLAVPEWLRGDPGRLRQILANLTDNAIKFTPVGEVEVSVALVEDSAHDVLLRFAVRDTGPGIPEHKIGLLFDKFSQLDPSTTRQFGGTGLGLAISKQLAELMGGAIGITSTPGQGSEFWFTARLGKPESPPEPPQQPSSLQGVRILLVDDNTTHLDILTTRLHSWDMRPCAVPNAAAALHALYQALDEADPFRLALIDMRMPDMDGAALGRAIKADNRLAHIQMAILTSLKGLDNARHFEEIGFAAYMTKPIWHQELKTILTRILLEADGGGLPQRPIAMRHGARNNHYQFSGHKARILLAEDNITNQQVALGILNKLGLRADAVANGAEAVNALEAIPYDLILMDVQMPEMDGYEATRLIRSPHSAVRNHQVPIIAMTANAMHDDREKCLRAGMDDYVPKPVSPQSLAEVLIKWLPTAARADHPEDAGTHSAAAPASTGFTC
jgi:PAS domain S-box-containing protein